MKIFPYIKTVSPFNSDKMNNDTEKPKLYLETTVPSYLTARQSRDVIQLARQQITAEWWNSRLNDFDVFISQIVNDEAGSGDPDAARGRYNLFRFWRSLRKSQNWRKKYSERESFRKKVPGMPPISPSLSVTG